jgi:hypothetical protein
MSAKFIVFLLVVLFSAFGCQSGGYKAAQKQDMAAPGNNITPGEQVVLNGERVVLNGEIIAIQYYDAGNCLNSGIHIRLKTASAVIPVHLGPAWYVNQQERLLSVGSAATVRGLHITFDGQPAALAIEISTSGGTLKLRDDNGAPYWRGQRRNQKRWGPVCPMYPGF